MGMRPQLGAKFWSCTEDLEAPISKSKRGANKTPTRLRGDMALTDENLAFGPAEQGIRLEMSRLDRFGAIWIDSDTFEKIGILTLENQSSRPQNLVFGAPGTENPRF